MFCGTSSRVMGEYKGHFCCSQFPVYRDFYSTWSTRLGEPPPVALLSWIREGWVNRWYGAIAVWKVALYSVHVQLVFFTNNPWWLWKISNTSKPLTTFSTGPGSPPRCPRLPSLPAAQSPPERRLQLVKCGGHKVQWSVQLKVIEYGEVYTLQFIKYSEVCTVKCTVYTF